jgi:hypothetical protein
MTITAGQVINEARDYHAALSKTAAPDRLSWNHLTRTMNRFRDRIMVRVPAFFAAEFTQTLTAAIFSNGLNLASVSSVGVKAFTGPIRFLYASSSPARYVDGQFIPWEQRTMNNGVPAYTLINNVVKLLAGNGVDDLATAYQNYDSMVLSYTANVTPIVANANEITGFPDDAREALALSLVAFHLRRMVGSPQYNVKRVDADYFDAQATDAANLFYTRITRGITQVTEYYIQDRRP